MAADLCYVCAKARLTSKEDAEGFELVHRVGCPRCGSYRIAQKLISGDKNRTFLSDDARVRLSHAIRKATEAYGIFGEAVLDFESVRALADKHPLPDSVEQADMLIVGIAQEAAYGDKTHNQSGEAWAARIGMREASQVYTLQQELEKLVVGSPLPNGDVNFKLTLEGWRRYREIRRERGPGDQAFVAMWFHPDMNAAFDDGFYPALKATDHEPYRVDRDNHNLKIDDKIVAEIRRSKLVVVDVTGARPNAYFEAGFAMGLGIPVIWCCNDSWDAHVQAVVPHGPPSSGPVVTKWSGPEVLAFDTRQHAFTFWSDPADLKQKLTNRIRALGIDAAWNRSQ